MTLNKKVVYMEKNRNHINPKNWIIPYYSILFHFIPKNS